MEKYNLNEGNESLKRVLLMMGYNSKKTLEENKEFLLEIAECLNIGKPYITEKVKTQVNYILWIENKQEVLNSIDYLYSDATYFLKRKYDKVVEFNMTIKSEAEDTSSERLETT